MVSWTLGVNKGTKVTVYKTVCVRGSNCPLDCMDTNTRMVYRGPGALLIMSFLACRGSERTTKETLMGTQTKVLS